MKRKLLVTLIAGWLGLGAAQAAVVLEFHHGMVPIVVTPGETFSFDVRLLVDDGDAVVSFDYYLLAEGANYLNGFSILTRTSNLTFFSVLATPDAEVAELPGNVLASTNSRNLGAIATDFSPIAGPGQYAIATFVLTVAPDAAPGDFTISSDFSSWVDGDFEEQQFSFPAEISVEVVPEPSVLALLAAGAAMCAFARRRNAARSRREAVSRQYN